MQLSRQAKDAATGAVALFVVLALVATTAGWIASSFRQLSVIDNAPAPLDTATVVSTQSPAPTPRFTPTFPARQSKTPSMTPTTPPIDCTQVACVALTFDDGPSPQTAGLLDALASRNVKATFFLVGTMVQRRPDAVAAIAAAGMVIGNHSYSHPSLKALAPTAITQQIQQASDAIVAAGGPAPTLLRPPYGDRSAALTQVAQSMGLVEILWNVDPEDWTNPGADAVVQRVVSAAKPGSIILMHDLHQGTVDALPRIIDALQAKGMTLVTVPELIGQQPPGANVFFGPKG